MLPTMISNHSPILVYNLVEVGGSILTEVCDRDLVKNQDFSAIRKCVADQIGHLEAFRSADAIAKYFRSLEVTGTRTVASRCPVANYLQRCSQHVRIHAYGSILVAEYKSSQFVGYVGLRRIQHFISKFDARAYPDLIEKPSSRQATASSGEESAEEPNRKELALV
jgi:hypothetical protein